MSSGTLPPSGTRKPRFMGSTASAQSSFSPVVVAPEEGMMDILDMAKFGSFPLGYWKVFWKLVWFAIELKRTIDPSCICSKHQFHRKSLIYDIVQPFDTTVFAKKPSRCAIFMGLHYVLRFFLASGVRIDHFIRVTG